MDSNRKLKAVDTKQLEDTIAKAVTELTGWTYTCSVNNVEYGSVGDAEFKLVLRTSEWLTVNLDEQE